MNFFARAAWALARVRGLAAGVVLALAASHGAAAQCPDFCEPSCPEYDPCACFGHSKCNPGCPGYDPCFCDPMMCDDDGDGVPNHSDGCPFEFGLCFDGCPPGPCGCGYVDGDADGIEDCFDNCASIYNPWQSDCDGNGIGDECDIAADPSRDCDGGGVLDACDVANGADCNANGIPDSCDIASGSFADCNSNGVLDSCEIASGMLEDCNQNGLADSCEKQVSVNLSSGRLSPFGFVSPHTWVIRDAVRAVAGDAVVGGLGGDFIGFRFLAQGDFSGSLEFVRVTVGGIVMQDVFSYGGADCSPSWGEIWLTIDEFNGAIGADGALRVVMEPSIAVDAALCGGETWIEVEVAYTGAASSDCNANDLLDSCEIAAGYAPDSNGNGIIDACESPLAPCRVDFDGSGSVDGADLGLLLAAWSSSTPAFDLNSDGIVDGADMGLMLAAWGSCDN